MTEVHYGVVRVGDRWSIIGDNLRFGAYETRGEASTAWPSIRPASACQ